MKAADQQKLLEILTDTITAKPIDWSDIVKAVKAQMTIKDWMKVRGVLQWMINQGQIKRFPSIHVEQYQTV